MRAARVGEAAAFKINNNTWKREAGTIAEICKRKEEKRKAGLGLMLLKLLVQGCLSSSEIIDIDTACDVNVGELRFAFVWAAKGQRR